MMHLLYNIGILGYTVGIRLAAAFNDKARLWVNGRKNLIATVSAWRKNESRPCVWIHCASLGEFEQGRPLIEAIKKQFPQNAIVLTFFSPSGYEVRKNYSEADLICYLPADSPKNASQFLEALRPTCAIMVKYEYWANYFFECKRRQIPLFMVSAILRPDQRFFGSNNRFWIRVLQCVDHFFVQNQRTAELLMSVGRSNATICGDTRYDRVKSIADQATDIEGIAQFKGNRLCLVLGSSWPAEEEMTHHYLQSAITGGLKIIIVPHEVNGGHISQLLKRYKGASLWTETKGHFTGEEQILILDTMGMLSRIYRYADVALIGGGFGRGIHNILEAAVWNVPVLFGPKHQKFDEATALIACGGGFSFSNQGELDSLLERLLGDENFRKEASSAAGSLVRSQTGASEKILSHLKNKNILK